MCKEASFVVCKGNKVFMSRRSDRHTVIREDNGLPDNDARMIRNVQVELCPAVDKDFLSPFKTWKFRVDQDLLPDWWDPVSAEKACRAELEEWAKLRLVRPGETRDVNDGDCVIVCGGTVNEVRGGTVNEVCGGTVNYVYGGTVNEVCGGTVCFNVSFAANLVGKKSVIIDRSGDDAICYVGTGTARTVSSSRKQKRKA